MNLPATTLCISSRHVHEKSHNKTQYVLLAYKVLESKKRFVFQDIGFLSFITVVLT